jgi:hypothetical protein
MDGLEWMCKKDEKHWLDIGCTHCLKCCFDNTGMVKPPVPGHWRLVLGQVYRTGVLIIWLFSYTTTGTNNSRDLTLAELHVQ